MILKNCTGVVISMYNLTEYSDIYSKTLGSLCQYYRNEAALYNAGNIFDFPANNDSISFKLEKIISQTGNDARKDVEIMVALKYLSNFPRTIETQLINCEINLILTWSPNCFIELVLW